jgi:hypothetical protein
MNSNRDRDRMVMFLVLKQIGRSVANNVFLVLTSWMPKTTVYIYYGSQADDAAAADARCHGHGATT